MSDARSVLSRHHGRVIVSEVRTNKRTSPVQRIRCMALDSVHGNRVQTLHTVAVVTGNRSGPSVAGKQLRPLHARACVLALLAGLFGCGGTVASPGPDLDEPVGRSGTENETESISASPGTFTPLGAEAFRVVVFVRAEAGATARDTSVLISVQVVAQDQPVPIRDAIVTAGSIGHASVATQTRPGEYTVQETGYAPGYELTVERPGAGVALRGVRLRSPGFHAVRPDRSHRGKPSRVGWSPNREGWVDDVSVYVFGLDAGTATYKTFGQADTGSFELPGEALPNKGSYLVTVRRASSIDLATPRSLAFVELETHASLLVP